MRGFEAFLFSVALPALFVCIFGFALGDEIRKYCVGSRPKLVPVRKRLIWAFVSIWMALMTFVVYRELRTHFDLWTLHASNVQEIAVGEHHFSDQASITRIVTTLKSSEWYSVNHGGWGDETTIVVRMTSGTEWHLRAGYHFAQHGAVVLRSSQPSGRGWNLGEVFSSSPP